MPRGVRSGSPGSAATPSEMELQSSPGGATHDEGRSFAGGGDDDTKMTDVGRTPDPTTEKTTTATTTRGGKGGGKLSREQNMAQNSAIQGKIRHLKKEDGEPLWRKDIQYEFLKAVFDDESTVFTNSYESQKIGKQNFADLYIDTMSRSSKTSKILREKLLSDREAAKSMAMVCLLVNIGRMNTTLNCRLFRLFLGCCQGARTAADIWVCKSSPRCGRSYGRTMRSPPSKPTRTLTHTSSSRTHHA